MSIGLIFWVIMLVWLVFGLYTNWPAAGSGGRAIGGVVLEWILFALLGWAVFGAAIHR